MDNHSKVLETPKGPPPIHDHDHSIHLIPGSVCPNIRPSRYPYAQKSEIECMVAEMLEAGIIQPNQSSFSAPVVLMHKKDGSCCMFLDYRELNKLTIKDKFPIPVINELLDELHGLIYFTKLDIGSGYLQIRMNIEDIRKTTLLKKDAFSWTLEETKAFEHLKEAMCQALILATPDFTITFIVEYDASGNGISDVLTQEERPIAFESHPIKGKYLHKAIYEKEMLASLHALKKW